MEPTVASPSTPEPREQLASSIRNALNSLQPLVSPSRRVLNSYTNRLQSRRFLQFSRNRRSNSNSSSTNSEQPNATEPASNNDTPVASSAAEGEEVDPPDTSQPQENAEASTEVTSTIIEIDNNAPDTNTEEATVVNNADTTDTTTADQNHQSIRSSSPSPSNSPSDTQSLNESSSASSAAAPPAESSSDPENTDSQANEGDNRSPSESVTDLLNQFPELRNGLIIIWRYFTFLLIVVAKAMLDHVGGIAVILFLALAFAWSNSVVKSSVSIQTRRPIYTLVLLSCNLTLGLLFVFFFYHSEKIYYSIMLLPPEKARLSFCDLMWIVIVTDYIVKIVTVQIKAFITIIALSLKHWPSRGKYVNLIEMSSQLYRSILPIQPWISYLLDNYFGHKRILGMFFSAIYIVMKGPDLITRWKNFQESIVKLSQNVNYGSIPSKAEMEDAGGLCPICHDHFLIPTMLQCKHIFCEQCVVTWFDRERTCPMCRTQVADDPAWKDGGTTHFVQLY